MDEKIINAKIVDVREPGEFATEKIPGSHSVPLSQLQTLAPRLDKHEPILLMCRGGGRARQAESQLQALGFTNLRVFEGGIMAWKAQGKPVDKGTSNVWAMERQVRFTAGVLVLVGVLGSFFVHPYLVWLSAFVGGGLTFSALTDTCTMARVLGLMPWNRPK